MSKQGKEVWTISHECVLNRSVAGACNQVNLRLMDYVADALNADRGNRINVSFQVIPPKADKDAKPTSIDLEAKVKELEEANGIEHDRLVSTLEDLQKADMRIAADGRVIQALWKRIPEELKENVRKILQGENQEVPE